MSTAISDMPTVEPRKRVNPILIVIPLLVLVAIAAVFAVQLSRRNMTQPTDGLAPDFTLTTFSNETYTLSKLRGTVVVVNFWASWCGPCRAEAPELESTWQAYKDKGVLFLGVAYTDTERGAKAFVEEFKTTYPNGLDFGTRISTDYRITGIPETFIVDRAGNVAYFAAQPLDRKTLSAQIDKVLAGKNGAQP